MALRLPRVLKAGHRKVVLEDDIRHLAEPDRVLTAGAPMTGVIHFAGLKAVGELVQQLLR